MGKQIDLRPSIQSAGITIAALQRDLGYKSYGSFYPRIAGFQSAGDDFFERAKAAIARLAAQPPSSGKAA